MELYYSDNYKKSDFENLEEVSNKKRYGQKSLEATAIICLVIYGAIKITGWFAQGYFTKLGELTAENNFKKYQDFKSKLAKTLFKNSNPVFAIQFNHNNCQVRVFFNPSSEDNFKNDLDATNEIYNKITKYIDSKRSEIKMMTISLKDSIITDLYYVDKDNNIFSIDR